VISFVQKVVDMIGVTISKSHKADSQSGEILQPQRPAKRRAVASPVEATLFVAGTYLSGLLTVGAKFYTSNNKQ